MRWPQPPPLLLSLLSLQSQLQSLLLTAQLLCDRLARFEKALKKLHNEHSPNVVKFLGHRLQLRPRGTDRRQAARRDFDTVLYTSDGQRIRTLKGMREFFEAQDRKNDNRAGGVGRTGAGESEATPPRERQMPATSPAAEGAAGVRSTPRSNRLVWVAHVVLGKEAADAARIFSKRLPGEQRSVLEVPSEVAVSELLLFLALPMQPVFYSKAAWLAERADAVLLVRTRRFELTTERPCGGTPASEYKSLVLSAHVQLVAVCTIPAATGRGAASSLVRALETCVRAGRHLYVDKPACQVGSALKFWEHNGLLLKGGSDHPLPSKRSRGTDMPASADRRTLYKDVQAQHWNCWKCSSANTHLSQHCCVESCGVRRADRLTVVAADEETDAADEDVDAADEGGASGPTLEELYTKLEKTQETKELLAEQVQLLAEQVLDQDPLSTHYLK